MARENSKDNPKYKATCENRQLKRIETAINKNAACRVQAESLIYQAFICENVTAAVLRLLGVVYDANILINNGATAYHIFGTDDYANRYMKHVHDK